MLRSRQMDRRDDLPRDVHLIHIW